MQIKTLFQRERQAVLLQIGFGGGRIPAAVTQINLLVGVQGVEVDGVTAVVFKQAHVDIVQPRDADAHVLIELLAERRIFW